MKNIKLSFLAKRTFFIDNNFLKKPINIQIYLQAFYGLEDSTYIDHIMACRNCYHSVQNYRYGICDIIYDDNFLVSFAIIRIIGRIECYNNIIHIRTV